MKNKLKILSLTIVMFGVIPSVFAQGFWQRLGQAVLGVAAGAAEGYVGSTLNDQDRQAWNDISNDINNGLGLNNGYVNAGNKLQEGETRDAVVNMGVTAASNSGNRTLITVSNTVKAQNDYVNNVSSGMDRKTAQEVAAKQISDVWLDDMEERERVANERKKEEYNTTRTEIYSAPSRTENSAPCKAEQSEQKGAKYTEVSSVVSNSNIAMSQKERAELRATLNDMTKEYWEKNEEYEHQAIKCTSNSILKYKKESLEALSKSIKEVKGENFPIALIGNKCDLNEERQVDKEEGENEAKKNGFLFFETSNKDGTNVEEATTALISKVVELRKKQNTEKDETDQTSKKSYKLVAKKTKKKRHSCCQRK